MLGAVSRVIVADSKPGSGGSGTPDLVPNEALVKAGAG